MSVIPPNISRGYVFNSTQASVGLLILKYVELGSPEEGIVLSYSIITTVVFRQGIS